jgi:hypothetical protein
MAGTQAAGTALGRHTAPGKASAVPGFAWLKPFEDIRE